MPALYLSLASRKAFCKAFSLHSQRQWQSTHAPCTPNCHHGNSHNQHSDSRRQELVLHWSESQALSFAGGWGEMFASLDLEPRLSPCLVVRLVGSLFVCRRRTCPFLDLARYVSDELNPCINAFIGKWVLTLKESTELTLLSLPSFPVSLGRRWVQLVPSSCLDLIDDLVLSSSAIGGLRPMGHRNRPSRVAVLVALVLMRLGCVIWSLQLSFCTFIASPDFDRGVPECNC